MAQILVGWTPEYRQGPRGAVRVADVAKFVSGQIWVRLIDLRTGRSRGWIPVSSWTSYGYAISKQQAHKRTGKTP